MAPIKRLNAMLRDNYKQIRCIKKIAKLHHITFEQAFAIWDCKCAEQWRLGQ